MSTPMYDGPEHFAIPVDADGNGPAEGDAIVGYVCWCGVPGCDEPFEHCGCCAHRKGVGADPCGGPGCPCSRVDNNSTTNGQ